MSLFLSKKKEIKQSELGVCVCGLFCERGKVNARKKLARKRERERENNSKRQEESERERERISKASE